MYFPKAFYDSLHTSLALVFLLIPYANLVTKQVKYISPAYH